MGRYQSTFVGLRHDIFFVVIDQRTSMPAKCNRSNRDFDHFISKAGICYQVYVIILPVYINHKDSIFLSKTGLFHAFTSNSLRVPTQIVNEGILIIFISKAGICYQVYVIILPVYINHKDCTFLYKTDLFHAFMSNSLRVPAQIVKYVKNGHVIFGRAINVARAAW